jgi:hypothetical protein
VQRGEFERFLGVDLGGGKGKKTALAVLERRSSDAASVAVVALLPRGGDTPLYDGPLIDAIRARADRALLCVDAPLTLPPCLRCQVLPCPGQEACVDPAVIQMRRLGGTPLESSRDYRRGKPPLTPYTQRPTEIYLQRRRGVTARETLGQGMGPLTARAAHLRRALADQFVLDRNLLEVYPKATLQLLALAEAYKKRPDARLRLLECLPGLTFGPGVWREECVQSDHAFDAILCAFTGYLYAREGWTHPPDAGTRPGIDGWIWVPPEPPAVDQSAPANELDADGPSEPGA